MATRRIHIFYLKPLQIPTFLPPISSFTPYNPNQPNTSQNTNFSRRKSLLLLKTLNSHFHSSFSKRKSRNTTTVKLLHLHHNTTSNIHNITKTLFLSSLFETTNSLLSFQQLLKSFNNNNNISKWTLRKSQWREEGVRKLENYISLSFSSKLSFKHLFPFLSRTSL